MEKAKNKNSSRNSQSCIREMDKKTSTGENIYYFKEKIVRFFLCVRA